ncbi:MAG: GDSL-type esterase/lipase family protein [Leptospiraceae bacterium]|nr:GDSL-type esterase/lipase family protein [Leptospiraceae bacterium]
MLLLDFKVQAVLLLFCLITCTTQKRKFYSNYFNPDFQCSSVEELEDKRFYSKHLEGWNLAKTIYEKENLQLGSVSNVIVGDSIVALFSKEQLNKEFPGLSIVTRGIAGDTSFTLLKRLEENVFNLKPKSIIVHIGGNDLMFGKCISVIESNILQLVKRIKLYNPSTKIYFVSAPPTRASELNSIIPTYNLFLLQLALSDKDIFYIDSWSEMREKDSPQIRAEFYRDSDFIHFNEKGYEVLGRLLRPYLK